MDPSAVDRVMLWIAGAYPDGVPKADRAGLVGVLRDFLPADELAEVAQGWKLDPSDPAAKDDIARVAGHLVAGGWPLAAPSRGVEPAPEGVVARTLGGVIAWLRAGYPEGVPAGDFIPLVAILERRLTKAEVKQVRKDLQAAGLLSPDLSDIADAIESVIHEQATPQEIARVTAHLRKKGWPVEFGLD